MSSDKLIEVNERRVIKAKLRALPVEELANTITHGLGLLLSIVGFLVLVILSGVMGNAWLIASCVIYGMSLVVLYAASTVYHSTTSHRMKKNLQVVDHCCIYLLIAGSYTPFGMIIAGDSLGRGLMVGIWAFAIVGVIVKLIIRDRFAAVNVISYVLMGWLGVFAVQPLFHKLGMPAVVLIIASGIAYSLGVIFFPWTSIKHHHAIFHVFILAGSIIHYFAVLLYVIPYAVHL